MIFRNLFGDKKVKLMEPQHIQSVLAGTLVRDGQLKHYWTSKPIAVPLFGGVRLPVTFSDYLPEETPDKLPEYERVLGNFLKLDLKVRALATPHVHRNCREAINSADWEGKEQLARATGEPSSVWEHVKPRTIYVSRRMFNDMDLYVLMECDCAWEEEHGLALVYRQGKQLTRVGSIDGQLTEADARNVPDEDDELLSAWTG